MQCVDCSVSLPGCQKTSTVSFWVAKNKNLGWWSTWSTDSQQQWTPGNIDKERVKRKLESVPGFVQIRCCFPVPVPFTNLSVNLVLTHPSCAVEAVTLLRWCICVYPLRRANMSPVHTVSGVTDCTSSDATWRMGVIGGAKHLCWNVQTENVSIKKKTKLFLV